MPSLRHFVPIALLALLVPATASATPTTVVVDETIFFSSGAQAALFPMGGLFRITFTYDPETPDLDGTVNGSGAFPGTISSATLELADLVFEYGGGMTSSLLTTDDLGLAPNLQDSFTMLPGPYVSGTLDGLVPGGIQVESVLLGAAPTMTLDDVLQPEFAYSYVSVTFMTSAGTTVISTDPGMAMAVPEPSLAALLGAGLLAAVRVRRRG